jgi:CRP-like cAMP-binding protein
MASFRQSPNDFLAALPDADFGRLRPHLRTVELVLGDTLVEAGGRLLLIYFPHSGIISKVVQLAGGEAIDVAMIGRADLFGGSAALFGTQSPTAGIVRFPGLASTIDVAHFRAVVEASEALRGALMQRQWQQIVEAEQSAACNASHSIEARLCRRLLTARELSGSSKLPLTQEILGQMLGVQRNSISLVANALQQRGLIRYSRGQLEITDVEGLTAHSCECYQSDAGHIAELDSDAGVAPSSAPPR